MKKYFVLVAIIIISLGSAARAQSADEMNKLRIAQALEQAGEYGKALDFYRQLHDSSPHNYVYFDGLRRAYMNLKEYDSAEVLIRARLATDPKNVALYCDLGDAYFKAGSQDSALDVWNEAIEVDPKNSGTYQAVADIMTQNRLFNKAIEVFKRGEKTTSYKSGFIIQIARLYFYTMNYRESLRELLGLMSSDNKASAMAYIQSQLGAYSTSKQAVDEFTDEMQKQVAKHSDNDFYRRILAFLYMEQKNYAAAYDTYKWLDDHSGAKGIELLSFAERAYNDEAYSVAAKAYEEVSHLSKVNEIIAQSIMGYAGSLRMLGERNYSAEDRPCSAEDSLRDLNAALAAYGRIISDYPKTQFLSPAVLSSIEIRMNYFRDVKGAERLFSQYDIFPPEFAGRAALARIELYMMQGRFKDALSAALAEISSGTKEKPGAQADVNFVSQVRYDAARALYFMGDFDSAAHYLGEITTDPTSDAANEAIRLSNLIENNKDNPQALKAFASADAMNIEGRIPEEALQLEDVLKSYPGMPLAGDARFQLAAAYCTLGNVKEALHNYSLLAADSTGIYADRAQLRIARIYDVTLHDSTRALTEYENFLARFPNSIYQDKVRKILTKRLGDNS